MWDCMTTCMHWSESDSNQSRTWYAQVSSVLSFKSTLFNAFNRPTLSLHLPSFCKYKLNIPFTNECRCTWEHQLVKMSIWNSFYIFVFINCTSRSHAHIHNNGEWLLPIGQHCNAYTCMYAQNLLLNRQFQFNQFN